MTCTYAGSSRLSQGGSNLGGMMKPTRPPKAIPTPLGLYLRRAREAIPYNREELAVYAGIRLATVMRIESGNTPDPHFSTVVALCGVLGISLDEMVAELWPDEEDVPA